MMALTPYGCASFFGKERSMARHLPRVLVFALAANLVGPSLALGERPVVLVNPHVRGDGTARTIQEGVDMVDPGGRVMVLPGTYHEAIVIEKGLTLEAVGGATATVIIAPPAPPAGPTVAIQVATPEPVIIRDATVQFIGVNGGIRGDGVVDVTVERVRMTTVDPLLGAGFLVAVSNNNVPTNGRARLTVSESFLDGTVPFANSPTPAFPQVLGIRVQGDVDAWLEGNVIRRTGGACIVVFMRNDFGGVTNADILDNDLDECYPLARAGSLIVQAQFVPPTPATVTGVVNIVGNTIRNTFGSCLPTTAIVQSFGTGRIERNRVLSVVQPCAVDLPTRTRGAVWIGSTLASASPPSTVVRFNDIEGNAYAGLRIGSNITTTLDARCNWWGSASGPSGVGPGTGDAVLLQSGATTPDFTPWAVAPIAETEETTCTGGSE
jgi:hypothetical protein